MKSGFGHFDSSHRENFCAAVLLLAMELDEGVKTLIARLVREQLAIPATCPLVAFGREARLEQKEDGGYARVDLWLLFECQDGPRYAFVEVKTHCRWEAEHVARQVRDQSERRIARNPRRICGSVLLGPPRLCRLVQNVDKDVRAIDWLRLIGELRALPEPSMLTTHAIEHLEEQMEHPPGLNQAITLDEFEAATKIVACLRGLLVDCIADVGGNVHGEPLFTTPGDGRPRRSGDWAWHGLAVPFTLNGKKGRIGVYKYSDTPAAEVAARETLWLEAYLEDTDTPVAFVKFTPPTLASQHLEAVRAEFKREWPSASPLPGG